MKFLLEEDEIGEALVKYAMAKAGIAATKSYSVQIALAPGQKAQATVEIVEKEEEHGSKKT